MSENISKPAYRLLALDLDGTTIREDLRINPRLPEILRQVQANGTVVTIATGRMHRSAALFARELGLSGPLISYQGAMVRDIETGHIYYHNPLPLDLAIAFVGEIMARKIHAHIYANDEICVAKMDSYARYYGDLNRLEPVVVGNLVEYMAREQVAPTKALAIADPDVTTRLVEEMREKFSPGLYITRSFPTFTDAVNPESSKGAALASLAKSLDIPPEHVMAIGDNLNDVPMLTWAGLGVAVAGATPAAKEAADYVTRGEVSEGVIEAVQKFLL